jgi:hypothetical protein
MIVGFWRVFEALDVLTDGKARKDAMAGFLAQ